MWDLLRLTPATASGTAAYALGMQADGFLVAVLLRPEAVVIVTVSRRLADLFRNLVEPLSQAALGGFAHLMASPERHRAAAVERELLAGRLLMAAPLAALYAVVNGGVVEWWVGRRYFAGHEFTALAAVASVLAGQAYLQNTLLRAAGRIRLGGAALLVESGAKIVLMAAGLAIFGIVALPAAAALVALGSIWWHHVAQEEIHADDPGEKGGGHGRRLAWSLGPVALAGWAAWALQGQGLEVAVPVGLAGAAGSFALLLWMDPSLGLVRNRLRALWQ